MLTKDVDDGGRVDFSDQLKSSERVSHLGPEVLMS